jgi:hypothetical protein
VCMGRGFRYSPGIRVYGLMKTKTAGYKVYWSSHLHLRGASRGT